MLILILLLLMLFLKESFSDWNESVINIVRLNNTNTIYLLLLQRNIKRIIPNDETVYYFNYDPFSLRIVNETDINHFKNGIPVKSLETSRQKTADERMRNYVHTILAVHEPTFWKEEYFIENICNPSIAQRGNRSEFLISWHCFDKEDVKFGWLKLQNSSKVYSNESLFEDLGLSPSSKFPIQSNEFNYYQHDPRLLVENDTSILVTYGVHLGQFPNGISKQSAVRINLQSDQALLSDSILLEYFEGGNQKNWIPFIYEKKILYIQNIAPLHVVELTDEGMLQLPLKSSQSSSQLSLPFSSRSLLSLSD